MQRLRLGPPVGVGFSLLGTHRPARLHRRGTWLGVHLVLDKLCALHQMGHRSLSHARTTCPQRASENQGEELYVRGTVSLAHRHGDEHHNVCVCSILDAPRGHLPLLRLPRVPSVVIFERGVCVLHGGSVALMILSMGKNIYLEVRNWISCKSFPVGCLPSVLVVLTRSTGKRSGGKSRARQVRAQESYAQEHAPEGEDVPLGELAASKGQTSGALAVPAQGVRKVQSHESLVLAALDKEEAKAAQRFSYPRRNSYDGPVENHTPRQTSTSR